MAIMRSYPGYGRLEEVSGLWRICVDIQVISDNSHYDEVSRLWQTWGSNETTANMKRYDCTVGTQFSIR
jgi:hypothetical protein